MNRRWFSALGTAGPFGGPALDTRRRPHVEHAAVPAGAPIAGAATAFRTRAGRRGLDRLRHLALHPHAAPLRVDHFEQGVVDGLRLVVGHAFETFAEERGRRHDGLPLPEIEGDAAAVNHGSG